MFEEPFEERYNGLLKKRIALEGELALTRRQSETALAKARKKNRRYLFLMLLLPFLTFWCSKKKYIQPLEQQVALQHDSIIRLITAHRRPPRFTFKTHPSLRAGKEGPA